MKHAFFFGAGASANFGMPTTDEMLDWLKEDKVFSMLQNSNKFENMEEFYTSIDKILSNKSLLLFMLKCNNQAEDDRIDSLVKTYTEKIRELQKEYLEKITKYLVEKLNPDDHTIELYEQYMNKLREIDEKSQLTIITTNYDLLLDKSFGNDWNDGFRPYSGIAKKWESSWSNDKTKPTLVKLHGSINWDDNTRHKKSLYRGIHQYKHGINNNPLMLPLTLDDKNYRLEPYNKMFEKFEEVIEDITLLVVIGYAFRDRLIREKIKEQLGKKLHVLLIDPKAFDTGSNKFSNPISIMLDAETGKIVPNGDRDENIDYNFYCYDQKFDKNTKDEIVQIARKILESIKTNKSPFGNNED